MSELIDRIFDIDRIEKDKKIIEDILKSLGDSINAHKDVISGVMSDTRKSKSTEELINQSNKLNDTYSKGKKTIDLYYETKRQLDAQEKLLIQTKAKLTVGENDNSKAIEKNKKELKEQNELLRAENILNDKNAGSLEKAAAANVKLGIEKKKLNLATEEGKKRLAEINVEQDKNNQLIQESGNKLEKQKLNIGNYKSAFSGLFGQFKAGEIGVGGLTKGVISLGKQLMIAIVTNPVLLVIGAIVGAFMALKNAIVRSEEGQDRLNKVMSIFTAMLDVVMDALNFIAIALFDAFSKPKESIKALGNIIKENVLNRFEALGKILPKVGELFEDLKKMDFKELRKDAGELVQELGAVLTGLSPEQQKKIADGIGKIGDKFTENAIKGNELARLQAEYNKLERKYIVENAELASISAKKRADAELLKKTNAKAALKLLEEAADADEKIALNEVRLAKMRLNIAEKESATSVDDIETKKRLAELEADVFSKQTNYDEKRRERQRNANKIGKEALTQQLENNKYIIEAMKSEAESSIKKNDVIAANEKESLENRLKAVEDNNRIRMNLLKEEYLMDKKTLDENLAIKFISQEDYDNAIKELDKKNKSALESQETDYQQNIKLVKEDALKTKLELFAKELTTESELIKQGYTKQEIELKKNYAKSKQTAKDKAKFEQDLAKLQLDALLEVNNKQIESLQKLLSDSNLSADKRAEFSKQLADLQIANENAVVDATIKANEDKIQSDKDAIAKRIEVAQALANATGQIFGAIADYAIQQSEQRIASLEKEKEVSDKTFEDQQNNLDNAIMSDEARAQKQKELNERKAASDKAIADKIQAEKIKQAKWDKANGIVQAIISGSLAVIKALVDPGGILGAIYAITAGTTAALQIATIASQPIPAYEKGGITGEGLALWGEKRPEVAVTPTGDVLLAEKPTISNFDAGTKIYKSVSDYENFIAKQAVNQMVFDYDKFGEKMPQTNINLDSRGLWEIVSKQGSRRTFINRKYRV